MVKILVLCLVLLAASPTLAVDYRAELIVLVVDPCLRAKVRHSEDYRKFRKMGEDQALDFIKSLSGTDEVVNEWLNDLMPNLEGQLWEVRKTVYELSLSTCLESIIGGLEK